MTEVIAIDPGPKSSAWATLRGDGTPWAFRHEDNRLLLTHLITSVGVHGGAHLVIEKVESFGMAVGADVFETVWWAGRFFQAWDNDATAHMLPRRAVKLHLCGTARAKDTNIRQALIDRFGGVGGKSVAVGVKAKPGPLYGVSSHVWSALALAITWADTQGGLTPKEQEPV